MPESNSSDLCCWRGSSSCRMIHAGALGAAGLSCPAAPQTLPSQTSRRTFLLTLPSHRPGRSWVPHQRSGEGRTMLAQFGTRHIWNHICFCASGSNVFEGQEALKQFPPPSDILVVFQLNKLMWVTQWHVKCFEVALENGLQLCNGS